MAGEIVSYYTDITDLTTVLNSLGLQRRGFINITLTNWGTTGVPQIKAGSVVENDGSLFVFNSDTTILGTAPDGVVSIKLVVATGPNPEDTTVTPTWTNITPVWNEEKQGYYEGASERVIAGATQSGATYTDKYILRRREDYFLRRYGTGNMQVIPGFSGNFTTNNVTTGNISTANITTGNVTDLQSNDYSKFFTYSVTTGASPEAFTTDYYSMVRFYMTFGGTATATIEIYDGSSYYLFKELSTSFSSPFDQEVFALGPGQYRITTASTTASLQFLGSFGHNDNTQSNIITILP